MFDLLKIVVESHSNYHPLKKERTQKLVLGILCLNMDASVVELMDLRLLLLTLTKGENIHRYRDMQRRG